MTVPFGLLDVRGDGTGIQEARLRVEAGLARRLREWAPQAGSSARVCSTWHGRKLLGGVSGREDVVFGTVLFGRMRGVGADRVMGLFINTLPVRIQLGKRAWSPVYGTRIHCWRSCYVMNTLLWY